MEESQYQILQLLQVQIYIINLKIKIEIFHRSNGEVDNHPKNHLFRREMTTPLLHMENSGLVQVRWVPKIIRNFKLHLARNNMTQEQEVQAFESTSYKGVQYNR